MFKLGHNQRSNQFNSFHSVNLAHILLRVSNNTLKVFINGTQALSQALTPDVTLSVNSVKLGYTSTSTALFIDEFVFRHSAGIGNPTVPTRPYSGRLVLDKIGGYEGVGTNNTGVLSTSTSRQVNSYGIISSITDTKTFTVSSWTNGNVAATAVREVMIHITAPKSTSSAAYPSVGLYAFAKIDSINGTNVVLSREISTANGDDFSAHTTCRLLPFLATQH